MSEPEFTFTDTTDLNRINYSALRVMGTDYIAEVDKNGRIFVYAGGEKFDTGVNASMPLPTGEAALYEVIRLLGMWCAEWEAM